MAQDRYFARSASDCTDDWPFWLVADRQKSGLNVTVPLGEAIGLPMRGHLPFLYPHHAKALAKVANERGL